MKRRIILSTALAMGVAVIAVVTSGSTATPVRPQRFVADTGMFTLGPNQHLRVTVSNSAPTGQVTFSIDGSTFSRGTCSSGVCRHSVTSQTPYGAVTLAPGQAASVNADGYDYAQFRVRFGAPPASVQVNAFIIDSGTGLIVGGVVVGMGDND